MEDVQSTSVLLSHNKAVRFLIASFRKTLGQLEKAVKMRIHLELGYMAHDGRMEVLRQI